MTGHDFANYWTQGFLGIEGWVDERLFEYLALVDQVQQAAGVSGHVGEIGVFHGKLLIGLAHLARPGSKVTAIDVFDDQIRNIDGAGVGSLARLEENVAAFGPDDVDYQFIKADSMALTNYDKIRLREERGPFRLFSVDGCHTLEHTLTDLLTAQDLLVPGGIIMLDDVFQPHWPGVTEAINILHERYVPRVRPFLYCCHKLFFVGHGWHSEFFTAVADQLAGRPNVRMTRMFHSNTVSVYP